jgi:hypothetical protein
MELTSKEKLGDLVRSFNPTICMGYFVRPCFDEIEKKGRIAT